MKYSKPIIEIGNKIFQNEIFYRQFIGKKLLLINDPTITVYDGENMNIYRIFKNFFDNIGCESSVFLLANSQPIRSTNDFVAGNLNDIAKFFPDDTFDFVILLTGLEKIARPLHVISDLKNICRLNGSLMLLTRKPSTELTSGIGSNLYWCEDFWRFEEQDILNLFPDDKVIFLSNINFPEESDEHGDVQVLFSQITLKTKNLPLTTIELFNCRTKNRTKIDDLNALGYFHQGILETFAQEELTDKSALIHNYLDKYEFFLSKFRNDEFTLLELGVFLGGSLRMWKKFFPHAQIVGVDIDQACQRYAEHRIKIETLDLSKIDQIESLKKYQPKIIVDDASHIWSHQIKALSILFPILPSGGIYIIEDLETSFRTSIIQMFDELYADFWGDTTIDAYRFCELINRVVVSKLKLSELFEESPVKNIELDGLNLEKIINEIGLQTELVAIIKGALIFIKR